MRQVGCFTIIMVLSLVSLVVQASERHTHYYRIAEGSPTKVERSPYVLVMTSADLNKFPHAVVTFELRTETGRVPSAIVPAETQPERLRGRRHYVRLSDNEFGRAGESQVVFDRSAHTVFIGFVGKEGRTFFFHEFSPDQGMPAQGQMQQLGKLDTE